ncbi:hypothetical protein RGR602_PB00435 (plasmid) [Rhizobium gallicum bv. gallicum R602sp]|uniref:Uncharacterized protein n=1 Tax=Rhizobium gallicum bv. gallicum R602sp TaxID=1041138 RepID=A0A0B4XB69_9HYPH|nr:hypothetical protein RGR602_PB00435 [Rhizobium gallicum bv. gallicum R602sp]
MKISIIVPVRLNETLFEGLPRLEQLVRNAPSDRFEVVVVDYGSPLGGPPNCRSSQTNSSTRNTCALTQKPSRSALVLLETSAPKMLHLR